MEFTTRFGLHSQATRLREAPGPARRGAATGLTPSAGCGLDHKDLGPPRAPPGRGASVASPKLCRRAALPARSRRSVPTDDRTAGFAPPAPFPSLPPPHLHLAPSRQGRGDRERDRERETGRRRRLPSRRREPKSSAAETALTGCRASQAAPGGLGGESEKRDGALTPPGTTTEGLGGRRRGSPPTPQRSRLARATARHGTHAGDEDPARQQRPRPRRRPSPPGRRERGREATEENASLADRRTTFPPGTGRPPPPPPPPPLTAGNGPARGDATSRAVFRRRPRRPGSARPPHGEAERQRDGPRGHGNPARPLFHGTTRVRGRGRDRRPPLTTRLPSPLRGLGEHRRANRGAGSPRRPYNARDRHAASTAPPAHPCAGPLLPVRRRASGSHAPPPAPEADAAETRAGIASARGPPVGKTRRRHGRTPGTAAAASHRRGPFREHAPGGRCTVLSRGATPAPLVSTQGPGGEAPPRPPAAPAFGPHAAGKGNGETTGRARAGTAIGDGRLLPARPSPQGGHPSSGDAANSARGRPHSPGLRRRRRQPSAHPVGRAAKPGAAGGRQRRCGSRRRPSREEARSRLTRRRTRACGGGRGERARRGPAAATPQLSTAPPPGTRAAAAAAAAAGRAEPPESLNLRPARRPIRLPRGVCRRRGISGTAEARSARYLALGTAAARAAPPVRGHGPAPPRTSRAPPRGHADDGARVAAVTGRTSPVAGSQPARPPARRDPERLEARPLEFLRRARGTARPGAGFCRAAKPPSPVREGPEEPPPPSPEGLPAPSRPLAVRHRPPTSHGRTAGRRPAGEETRGRGGCAYGRGRAEHPSLSHTGGFSRAPKESRVRENSSRDRAGARAGGQHQRPAFGGAGRGGEARDRPCPRLAAGTDRQRTGAGRRVPRALDSLWGGARGARRARQRPPRRREGRVAPPHPVPPAEAGGECGRAERSNGAGMRDAAHAAGRTARQRGRRQPHR
ncbi:collagen alpha-1(III) chain-like [Cinclus cinclus]|uniref:collagen alpha-1(III) chain-like n=1 Tax=Cinclus cinclus TaxID=127875 RepID=UPI002E160355